MSDEKEETKTLTFDWLPEGSVALAGNFFFFIFILHLINFNLLFIYIYILRW